jgi:hypothetical protein
MATLGCREFDTEINTFMDDLVPAGVIAGILGVGGRHLAAVPIWQRANPGRSRTSGCGGRRRRVRVGTGSPGTAGALGLRTSIPVAAV